MRINKHDTQGTKPLLGKGELGYDDYVAGGDTGRVYVGTGTENIALAEKLEANMMTKAQFNALAEERKANRAGSGFDNFGSNYTGVNNIYNVNQGLNTLNAITDNIPNSLLFSVEDVTSSKTSDGYPFALINGVRQKLKSIGANYNKIQLPTAPTIYPHDTVLTAEQIASGVIKHADTSNSGLIVNGKFDTDTSGWTSYLGGSITQTGGMLKTQSSTDRGRGYQYLTNLVIGKRYVVEAMVASDGVAEAGVYCTSINNVGAYDYGILKATISETTLVYKRLEFTATTTNLMLCCTTISSGTSTSYSYFDNIAVYPADAISRSDLVFLESWHEYISEKNFVYPLGNVQYLGGNTDGLTGIVNGAFTGFETYSLFGNWQTPSGLIGKGYVWSSLTEAQKRAFIDNPENNCYLDGDKVIQVRYRVRVVQGYGDSYYAGGLLYYSNSTGRVYTNNDWLKPKGKLVNITSDLTSYSVNETGYYSKVNTTFLRSTEYSSDYGILVAISKADNTYEVNTSYSGRNFAILLASVHRRNQGMYHPVYNSNGTKKASDGNFWYNTAVSFTNILDCFDPAKLLTASGYIGTVSGRPVVLFYDQVDEGDITDLRNSSKKVEDYNRLISREFNKLVAGSTRGKEGENDIISMRTFTKTSSFGSDNNRFHFVASPTNYSQLTFSPAEDNSYYLVGSNGSVYFAKQVINLDATGYVYIPLTTESQPRVYVPIDGKNTAATMNTLFPNGTIITVIVTKRTTRTKSNTLLHCDIIGNPTNYPTAWKESGVSGTPLIVAEDGISLLPDGTKDSFKLSRKANATPLLCLRSIDNGATWTSFTPTFSTITNEITLTDEPANNLVMVYYQTHTSMAVPVANSEIIEYGKALGTNGIANTHLVSTLIGKVSTANTAPYLQIGYDVNSYRIDTSTIKWSTTSTEIPVHSALSLAGGASGVPAVKVFPYLTRTNGKAYLNLVFKEMKHNGTSWGDDNKFNIVDNVSTTTDNNAQIVLIGQKTVELPYFIGADE